MNPKQFAIREHRDLMHLIRKFVLKYKAVPSKVTLAHFAEEHNTSERSAEKMIKALEVLKKLPLVNTSDANFYFSKLDNYALGRKIYDIGTNLQEIFTREEIDFGKLKQKLMTDLLTTGTEDRNVLRGFVYERVQERWDEYNRVARGETSEVIPFGIPSVDEQLGGMRKTFLTLFYSKTSGGKTRSAVNVAYNAALAGRRVMYITLEMAFDFLATCFDSRISWVDSKKILFGKLDKEEKKKYKLALKEELKKKLNIWIVDIAQGAKTTTIMEEIELYRAANGVGPDLVVIDYANLVTPAMSRFNGRSERYDHLFQEFHEIAKFEDTAILTATQESRDASLAEIDSRKKKDAAEEGVHNIAASNFMAPHCETVIRLKQSKEDRLQNRLWWVVDKQRYGILGVTIPLMAVWETSYVGDRLVPGTKVMKVRSDADRGNVRDYRSPTDSRG
jgi:replicative DNA helicase